jgi:oligopeptide transport system ATP-binding protein
MPATLAPLAAERSASTAAAAAPLLEVRDLKVRFDSRRGAVNAVNGVSFSIAHGETLAIVGESGSGKSTTGLAVMGLVGGESGCTVEGEIGLQAKDGRWRDLLRLPPAAMRRIRGNDIAMIFQEPMSSLNPVYSVESQICEAIRLHQRLGERAARTEALDLVRLLGIPNPEQCLRSYPHQLSGGMRQRVMIAIALSCRPSLLIADEPTTALDVTIQAQILDLLKKLQAQTRMAMIFITHNLGVVSEIADRVLVMYAGKGVEAGPVAEVFRTPRMPYTMSLLQSLPRLGQARATGERLRAIPGNVPNPLALPPGCAFHPRCAFIEPGRCDACEPPFEPVGADRGVRCLRWREIGSAP